ncbi:MAG: hypothetical protein LBE51_08700 [Acidovorax sp.]|jgi:hypothetical protein|nr:hypothetical protein [Acidovorax sp.]
MKETGLMFKAPLVRAILSGQKTQTRRVVKPQPAAGQGMVNAGYCGDRHLWLRDGPCDKTDPAYEWRCPMGQPGDRIYVRETFVQGHKADPATGDLRRWDKDGNELPMTTWYRATDQIGWSDDDGWETNVPWKPAIHMPKDLARIWLEVTGVRVERLQQISRGDAMAEGCPHPNMASGPDPREWFAELWDSTGGDWAANPWVWVIDFKTISTTGRPA